MVESNGAEQWPTGGSLGSEDRARTQKIVEVVIGSATAIALGVGCFFLGKFLLGGSKPDPRVALDRTANAARSETGRPGTATPPASQASATPSAEGPDGAAARETAAHAPAPRGDAPDTAEAFPGFEQTLTARELPTGDATTAAREVPPASAHTAAVPAAKTGRTKAAGKSAGKAPAKSATKSTAVQGDSVSRPAAKGASSFRVDGLTVCRAVANRMPEGAGSAFAASKGKLFCWIRVVNGQGHKVRHVWTLNGKRAVGVWLDVGSPWWRTWCSKKIDASMRGACTVEVEADDGSILGSATFRIE